MKKIVNIILTIVLIASAIFLLGFAEISHEQLRCEKVRVNLVIPGEDTIITLSELNNLIENKYGNLKGKEIAQISVEGLRKTILSHPYIDSCEIYLTVNKTIDITAVQRIPLIQFYNSNNSRYLMGNKGEIMPYPTVRGLNLPVATGMIFDDFDFDNKPAYSMGQYSKNSGLAGIYHISRQLEKDDFLKIMIDQIYLNERGDFELIPKVGTQIILLGDTTHLPAKLTNLKAFYKEIIPKSGWEYYKTVDLRFDNQVVCIKNSYDGNQ